MPTKKSFPLLMSVVSSSNIAPSGSSLISLLYPRNFILSGSGFSLNFLTFHSWYSVWNPCVWATSFLMNSFVRNAMATISVILRKFASQYPASKLGFLSSKPNASATRSIEIASALISCFVKNLIFSPFVCFLLCFPRALRLLPPLSPYLCLCPLVYLKLLPCARLFR